MLVLLVVLVLLVLLVVAPTGQVTVVGCRHRSVLPSVEVALPPQSGHNEDDTHVNVNVDFDNDNVDNYVLMIFVSRTRCHYGRQQ